jgi:TrmH RNA methyltransferase
VVALVDVENPHNVGAIVRSAAHFGARAVVVEGDRDPLSPSALRTAQGGAEAVEVLAAARIDGALDTCRRAGFRVLATSGREGRSLYQSPLPPRAVLLLGSEREGLPGRLLSRADDVLSIPGTGAVESLNVSVAAAVVLGEMWRQRQAR